MAKFTPSSLIAEIRGSAADITFTKNRSGPIICKKLVQPASNTPSQAARRAAMAAGILAWQSITETQFQEWAAFAGSPGRAYAQFVSRYVNRSLISGAGTGFPAWPPVRIKPLIASIVCGVNSITLSWLLHINPGTSKIIIFTTAPVSPGKRSFSKSAYTVLTNLTPVGLSGSVNIFSDLDSKYNLTSADNGKRMAFAVKGINSDNYSTSDLMCTNILLSGIT